MSSVQYCFNCSHKHKKNLQAYIVFMPIIIYYPDSIFPPALTKSRVQQQGCQGQGGELAPHWILSRLQKKNSIGEDFSGLEKK